MTMETLLIGAEGGEGWGVGSCMTKMLNQLGFGIRPQRSRSMLSEAMGFSNWSRNKRRDVRFIGHDRPVFHRNQPPGALREGLIVGDHDDGLAGGAELFED